MHYEIFTFTLVIFVVFGVVASSNFAAEDTAQNRSKLLVLWTSGDRDVALKVCFMYTHAAKKRNWFDTVKLVVWGPSAKLLAYDIELQEKINAMKADGVELQACVVCADSYGVSERLRNLEIEVIGMGKPLSDMLKEGWTTLTF